MTICDITPVPTNHLNTSCLQCQNEIDVIGLCDAAIYKWLFIGTSLVQIPTDSSKLIDAVVQWCIAWSVHCLMDGLLETSKQDLNTCHIGPWLYVISDCGCNARMGKMSLVYVMLPSHFSFTWFCGYGWMRNGEEQQEREYGEDQESIVVYHTENIWWF